MDKCAICNREITENDYCLKGDFNDSGESLFFHFDCIDQLKESKNNIMASLPEYYEEIIAEFSMNEENPVNITPSSLKNILDDFVVGQERAKTQLATAIYIHYKRIQANLKQDDDIEVEKSNVLMVGPSGSGKTWMIKVLAKKLGIPFVIQDCTSITANGLNVI